MRHVTSIWYYRCSMLLLLLITGFIGLTFRQHGISNDELVQHTYGQLLLKFYASGLSDQSAFHYKNLYLYGGLFDVIAAILEPLTSLWVWDLRHLLTAIVGLSGFYIVFKWASAIGGYRAGFFSLILLAITAPWTGAMFTHTKDIPFAVTLLFSSYFISQLINHPEESLSRISTYLGLSIGAAMGLRIGGGFAVVYLLIALIIAFLVSTRLREALLENKTKLFYAIIKAGLISFIIMAIFWPWGVMSPNNIFTAIKEFSHFSFNMLTIENHHVYKIGEVPRTYLLDYLMVKLPELSLLGCVGFLMAIGLSIVKQEKLHSHFAINPHVEGYLIVLLTSIAFPILFVLGTQPALYNGVRHFTFIVPPITVLAGLGLHMMFERFKSNVYMHGVLVSGCAAGLLLAVSQLHALHPYEYTYYNVLAGKEYQVKNSWEGDYWSSSLREVAPFLTQLQLPLQDKPYQVAVCAENIQASAYLDDRFEVTKDWVNADFYLSSTNMHCDQVLKGKIIGEVKRRNTTLAVVKDRRALVGDERNATPAPN